jgi:putative hemolysin
MIYLVLLLLLILINAYFSAAEIAIISVKKFRMQDEVNKGNKRAADILQLLKKPDEYLSSIQIGITLVGIFEGLYGGRFLQAHLEPVLFSWGMPSWSVHALSVVLGIGLITYITVIIGELLPKSVALQFPEKIALRIVPSFRLFSLIAYPFVKLLTGSTHLLLKVLRVRSPESQKLSDSDLKNLLGMAYRQGTLDEKEFLLHENIFNFYDQTTVEKIMTPVEKVAIIDESMTSEMIENILRNSDHNYFPVVQQGDKIIGCLGAKDFFIKRGKHLNEITQQPCTVTRNQKPPELLQKFKDRNSKFGIVINESGKLEGVVTMRDILEILVGKIP